MSIFNKCGVIPDFNNRENERVELKPTKQYPEGRIAWLSRSCAVVSTIIIRRGKERFCLMVKRGEGCPDENGKWVLPCGYLDWDETLVQGAIRELFEETGFYFGKFVIDDLLDNGSRIVTTNFQSGQPWFVYSGENDIKQNITHYFGAFIELPENENLPTLSSEHCEPNEVAGLEWVPLTDIGEYDIGFNHDNRIFMYMKHINRHDCFISRTWRNLKRWVYKKN